MTHESAIKLIAARLGTARHVAVLTGAGVSAESGLRTFRGATAATAADLPETMQALWKEFDPMTLATPEAFAADPERVSRWYDWRRLGCLAAEPNAGHVALAELERHVTERGAEFVLLTQNVDRLHQRAGSRNVVELHGTIMEWRCTRTGERMTPGPEAMTRFPTPTKAGGVLRPDVVWFGEQLPEEAVGAAGDAAGRCDVFLSVGTSANVYPAAGFIAVAARRGAFCAEVNLEPTGVSRALAAAVHGKSGEILPAIVAEMARMKGR